MKRFFAVLIFSSLLALPCGLLFAQEEYDGKIPEKIDRGHWSRNVVAELGKKFAATERLPAEDILGRKDLVGPLVAVMTNALVRYESAGSDPVTREDLDRIALLEGALKAELVLNEGYLTRRAAIEKMLARPEVPPFEYKAGVDGVLRGEGVGNLKLKDSTYSPGHGEGRFLYRIKPFAYWNATDYLDIRAEGQGYGYYGGNHQEYNNSSLYQGFVEARLPGRDWLSLKGGRQEFLYGSAFILGSDSFNDGLAFDAVRLRVKPGDSMSADLIAGAYAAPFSGGVKGSIAGVYLTTGFSEGYSFETYMFRDTGSNDRHSGEQLYIWGVRATCKAGPYSAEFEPVYESGRIFNAATGNNDRIDAFGGHIDLAIEAALAGHPNRIFLSYAYGSGSSEASNGGGGGREFRSQNNDSSLFGDMGLAGDLSGITVTGGSADHRASGLQIFTLGWGTDISKQLNFSATGHYYLANHAEDGFSRRLGFEADFTVTYVMADTVSFILGYNRFFTGPFFREASAKDADIDYAYLMMQFNLSASKSKISP